MEKRFWVYNKREDHVESMYDYEFKARQRLEQYAHINNGNEYFLLEVIATAMEPSHVEWTELRPKSLNIHETNDTCQNQAEASDRPHPMYNVGKTVPGTSK